MRGAIAATTDERGAPAVPSASASRRRSSAVVPFAPPPAPVSTEPPLLRDAAASAADLQTQARRRASVDVTGSASSVAAAAPAHPFGGTGRGDGVDNDDAAAAVVADDAIDGLLAPAARPPTTQEFQYRVQPGAMGAAASSFRTQAPKLDSTGGAAFPPATTSRGEAPPPPEALRRRTSFSVVAAASLGSEQQQQLRLPQRQLQQPLRQTMSGVWAVPQVPGPRGAWQEEGASGPAPGLSRHPRSFYDSSTRGGAATGSGVGAPPPARRVSQPLPSVREAWDGAPGDDGQDAPPLPAGPSAAGARALGGRRASM